MLQAAKRHRIDPIQRGQNPPSLPLWEPELEKDPEHTKLRNMLDAIRRQDPDEFAKSMEQVE
jgi:hypothetical protein